MEAILLVIVAVLAIAVLFCIVAFVAQVVWFALPAWLPGLALFAAAYYLLPRVAQRWGGADITGAVSLDAETLQWRCDKALLPKASSPAGFAVFASVLALATAVPVLISRAHAGAFDYVIWYGPFSGEGVASPGVSLAFGYIFGAALRGGGAGCLIACLPARDENLAAAQRLVVRLNSEGAKVCQLLGISAELGALREALGLPQMKDYVEKVVALAGKQKHELADRPRGFSGIVEDACGEATADLRELEAARQLRDATKKLLAETSAAVRQTGSMPLMLELEAMYEGLESTELRELLVAREWRAHEQVLKKMCEELTQLARAAERYAAYDWEEAAAEGERPAETMDEERACRILGVPPSASPDEIREMYRHLAKLWHPDRGKVDSSERMREINAAYDYLRAQRTS
jgi:hypothetical protein